jgi:acetyl esterase/lipase
MLHAPDPDEIASTNPEVLAYDARVTALGAAAPEPTLRLSYGPDRAQKLDVYAPEGARDRPILLFLHGGAWISGHLGWLRFMAPVVNAMGFVFVAGGYRLAPRLRWPAQYEDVRDALWFVSRNAEAFGGDPQQIVIGGHSAGGHLASLVALKDESPSLAGCMPVSSSFNLQYGDVPLESDAGRVYRYLFAERDQDFEASPINFAEGSSIPFHISWGERDFERVRTSSQHMTTKLPHATHQIVPGATHFGTHLALADPGAAFYSRLRDTFANIGAPA